MEEPSRLTLSRGLLLDVLKAVLTFLCVTFGGNRCSDCPLGEAMLLRFLSAGPLVRDGLGAFLFLGGELLAAPPITVSLFAVEKDMGMSLLNSMVHAVATPLWGVKKCNY